MRVTVGAAEADEGDAIATGRERSSLRVVHEARGGESVGSARRKVLLWSGNVLVASALGILAWLVVNHLHGSVEQRRLRSVAPAPMLASSPAVVTSASVIDMAGWASQDAAYWRSLASGGVFGRLVAPAMGLDHMVVKGAGKEVLRRGPGWVPSTALPGEGNTGISGHRTTYGAPFFRIHELEPGDSIDLYSPYRRYRYRVAWKRVVVPEWVEVLGETLAPSLTLTACHPWYSASRRIVVRAHLVEVRCLAPPSGSAWQGSSGNGYR